MCWEGEAGARQPGEKSDFLSPRAGKSPLGRTNLIMVGFATVCVCGLEFRGESTYSSTTILYE